MTGLLRAVAGAACCTWAVVFGAVFVGTRDPWAAFWSLAFAGAAWWLLEDGDEPPEVPA